MELNLTRNSNVQEGKMSEEEEVDWESFKHLAQLHHILQHNEYMNYRCIDRELQTIAEQPGNVSYQFPNNDLVRSCSSRLVGCTALHLVATETAAFWLTDIGQAYQATIAVLLVRCGIDMTLKNHKGSTALHSVVEMYYRQDWCPWRVRGKLENSTVNMFLSAHVERDVIGNPRDKNGLSHFHIACMANHTAAVEFFLSKAGVSVDEIVDGESSDYQGYIPLHLAIRCCAFEVVEILLKHGADVNVKNAKGMTPMDLLLEENVTMVDLINTVDNEDSAHYYRLPRLMEYVDNNKKLMDLLVSHADSFKFDDTGLTRFHVACTLDDITLVQNILAEVDDINQCVKMGSAFWPGYTALHFAAHFDIKTVKFLLEHGANIEAKDANELTPFDICVERYKVEDLHYILQSNAVWKDILMSDYKTKLLEVVFAMRDSNALDEFLKEHGKVSLRVPNDSPLWPGCTPLHLAIIFAESIKIITDYERPSWNYGREDFEKLQNKYFKRIEVCLKHGADVGVQDARGQTALHLAYRLQKAKVVTLLLQEGARIGNSVDEDNLSHLYIACAFDYPLVVKNFLANDNSYAVLQVKPSFQWQRNFFARGNYGEHRFFVTAGSTPLHVTGTTELIRMLLEHGADVNAKDATGVTLMHRVLACKSDKRPYMNSRTFMDVLSLGIRDQRSRDEIVELLLDNEADDISMESAENNSRSTAAGQSTAPKDDSEIQHFREACQACDLITMEKFLESGVDVNQPGNPLSRDFPGYRPIHLVLHPHSQVDWDRRIEAIDLLLKYDVDVDAGDLFDNNAFHVATLLHYNKNRIKIFNKIFSIGTNIKRKNVFGEEPFGMLLSSRKFEMEDVEFILKHNPLGVHIFNPMREEGCMAICFSKDYSIFKRIIRDPSTTKIDDFGRNAIHNIVSPKHSWGVDYSIAIRRLMERGCDIDHRDQLGRTPLQLALKVNNYKAVTRLLEAGADVNITDAKCHSAFADIEEWQGVFEPMVLHIRRLQITGLYVSELNEKILDEFLKSMSLDETKIERVKADLKKMKDVKIASTSLSPYDFFSETGAIAAFPYMSFSEQQAINNYFKYMRTYHFKQLGYLMKLRHKKALRRVTLVELARHKLNLLLKCTLPAKCSRRILRFLTNTDLENVIAVAK